MSEVIGIVKHGIGSAELGEDSFRADVNPFLRILVYRGTAVSTDELDQRVKLTAITPGH